jgi:predicted Ser/Thr protein kinase
MNMSLSYAEAAANVEKVLVQGRSWKADVYIALHRGRRFIVKDFSKKGFFERNFIGRVFISRECRAYGALAGMEGLPSQFKRLSPFTLAVEYFEGRHLGNFEIGEIGPGIILKFEAVVEDLHERGWVHLDLQRRSNILVVDGKVVVVDLASAIHAGSLPLAGRCLTRLLGFADRLSLIKIKSIYAPELITARERKWLKLRNLMMPRKW